MVHLGNTCQRCFEGEYIEQIGVNPFDLVSIRLQYHRNF